MRFRNLFSSRSNVRQELQIGNIRIFFACQNFFPIYNFIEILINITLSLDFISENNKFGYINPIVFLDFEKPITIRKLYFEFAIF